MFVEGKTEEKSVGSCGDVVAESVDGWLIVEPIRVVLAGSDESVDDSIFGVVENLPSNGDV